MSSHQAVLTEALEAGLGSGPTDLGKLFTDDVSAWSPNLFATSLAELEDTFGERDDALSNVELVIDSIEVVRNKAIAEWRVAADHTGPLRIGDDLIVQATGRRVILAGATFADFRGDKINAFRTYFDDAALLEQLLVEI